MGYSDAGHRPEHLIKQIGSPRSRGDHADLPNQEMAGGARACAWESIANGGRPKARPRQTTLVGSRAMLTATASGSGGGVAAWTTQHNTQQAR